MSLPPNTRRFSRYVEEMLSGYLDVKDLLASYLAPREREGLVSLPRA